MPMNERERLELQRLRDEFLELMRREIDAMLFDEEAKRRLGQAISRSMRQGNSEFSYIGTRPRRR
jgi:truncated hemoglobin YjbI